jgi:acyl-CoA synthetase (AMP-forming)/AMP-acid ligase II
MPEHKSRLPDIQLRPISITERLFEGLALSADRVILTDGPSGAGLTGATLEARIRRLASGLQAEGVGPGTVVAIMAPNLPDYVAVFHAVALAGATITTLNPTYTAVEAAFQLADSGASLLFTIPAFLPVAVAAAAGTAVREVVTLGPAEGHRTLDDLLGPPLRAQVPVDLETHVLTLPYSSGTTGRPKGVMLSHHNMVVNVDQIRALAGVQSGETTVAFLPFFHIYGMTVLMNMFLAYGAGLIPYPDAPRPAALHRAAGCDRAGQTSAGRPVRPVIPGADHVSRRPAWRRTGRGRAGASQGTGGDPGLWDDRA